MNWNPLSWFGTSKQVAKTADDLFDKDKGLLTQVGSWVGNMKFTDEEQAELNVKIADKAADFVASTLSENTERSKTRRQIAVLWIKTQLAPSNVEFNANGYRFNNSVFLWWLLPKHRKR